MRGRIFDPVTGLIYLVIIALWAAVLIPMWLRRHDQISEVRSTARFSSAMKSLSRVDDPKVDLTRQQATYLAARRRATVLATLIGVVLMSLLGGFAGASPKWLPILLASVLAAYLVAAAMTAPARAASSRRGAETSRRGVDAAAAPRSAADDFETWDAWEDEDDSWAAVPATIPTYVTAARATAVARPIDHAAGGVWSGSAMVDAANEMRDAKRAVDARSETAEIPIVQAPASRVASA
jgi:hypothetical protein